MERTNYILLSIKRITILYRCFWARLGQWVETMFEKWLLIQKCNDDVHGQGFHGAGNHDERLFVIIFCPHNPRMKGYSTQRILEEETCRSHKRLPGKLVFEMRTDVDGVHLYLRNDRCTWVLSRPTAFLCLSTTWAQWCALKCLVKCEVQVSCVPRYIKKT